MHWRGSSGSLDIQRENPNSLSGALVKNLFVIVLVLLSWSSRVLAAEAAEAQRPSLLLIVLDTVRVDAVSAYGEVDGTTPALDELASRGTRYTRAFAPAPWTLPSHATLFTGLRADEHRVAMPGHTELPIEFETLAELLGEAGYETAAFSENVIVSDLFGLLRGFEVRETAALNSENQEQSIDASSSFRAWLDRRDSDQPFFAFVNILDAHRPYTVRSQNPWVPEAASKWAIQDRHAAPERQICGALPTVQQIEIQRGLYLGDVHAADRKLSKILAAARTAAGERPLITVVTSDHGELFGEDKLLGHEFSVHSSLLRIPLVVHGAGGQPNTVIDIPVGLEDLMPTMLSWARVEVPDGLKGIPLPKSSASDPSAEATSRSFFAAYTDQFVGVPTKLADRVRHVDKGSLRQFCTASNRVFGGMATLIRYPFKYVWYERYPASLFDLSWDAEERSDQMKYRKALVESFESEMKPLLDASGVMGASDSTDLSKEALDALKQLGYVE
jgi:arylsulfatase A-like enzyme